MVSTCALCREDKELRNSHIISEFLYETMYDDKHRFYVLSLDERYPEFEQKGIREPDGLLCASCETKLSVWEGYGEALFSGRVPLRFENSSREGSWVHGIEYTKFKLFQLSILWRASVSKHKFFRSVALGPHEEEIRRMLWNEHPGEPAQYPCVMTQVTLQGSPSSVIVQPTRSRMLGATAYRFVLAGMFWVYVVASHDLPARLRAGFLQRNGTMALGASKNLEDAPFMQNFFGRSMQER